VERKDSVLEIAQAFLDHKIGAVYAAHLLYPLVLDSGVLSQDQENLIVGIVSSTDHLPMGSISELWDSTTLSLKTKQLFEADEQFSARMASVSREIMKTFV